MNCFTQSYSDVRNALYTLDKSIKRASEDVNFISTRKADLLAREGADPMAINLLNRALAAAEQELAYLVKTAEELRYEMARDEAA